MEESWDKETSYQLRAFDRYVERMDLNGDGLYKLPKCSPKLCCQIHPHIRCEECGATLCQDCLYSLRGKLPPWEDDAKLCGTWPL